jgi:2-keto-4-pentenoate hydratase/2-oxohepta-3-ene-1,7-dioic acid hydratase in catechol pathway
MRIARGRIGGKPVFGELEGDRFHCLTGDVFSAPSRTGASLALEDVPLLSPLDPARILLVLGGYMPPDGSPLPPGTQPRLAAKIVSGVGGDGSEIVIPSFVTTKIWIEVELAVVVGRTLRAADREQATDAIWGYTCFNDASAPEFITDLESGTSLPQPDYFRAKSIETFATMGPCIRTDLSEEQITEGLQLSARVNGELRARGSTSLQKFPVSEVVSFVSQQTTLVRGDVIALGTPQTCLAGPGDSVELEVEGIGSFRNLIVASNPAETRAVE